jgi:hypothetical protein
MISVEVKIRSFTIRVSRVAPDLVALKVSRKIPFGSVEVFGRDFSLNNAVVILHALKGGTGKVDLNGSQLMFEALPGKRLKLTIVGFKSIFFSHDEWEELIEAVETVVKGEERCAES